MIGEPRADDPVEFQVLDGPLLVVIPDGEGDEWLVTVNGERTTHGGRSPREAAEGYASSLSKELEP